MRFQRLTAVSSGAAGAIVLLVALAAVSVVYVTSTQGTADQLGLQSKQIAALQAQVQRLAQSGGQGGGNVTLPVMNQAPSVRTIRETWYLSPQAHQDRFDPSFIVVNQGDTVRLTFIDNDTVAHDFVIGPAYNIIVNATVPGLINDLSHQTFTGPAANNSPGVVIRGMPGNVSAAYSFVARYAGIYEFVCTYHAQVGMIGYLVVLPNKAYASGGLTTTTSAATGGSVSVSILSGAGAPEGNKGFSPKSITVVIGVNNTVVWTNNDSQPHTVTADGAAFDSGYMAAGATFTYTFSTPGVYPYHCTYHPWMTGTVVVKKAP